MCMRLDAACIAATRETRVALKPSELAQASLEPRLSLPSGAEAGHGKSCGLVVPAEEQLLCRLRGLQGRPDPPAFSEAGRGEGRQGTATRSMASKDSAGLRKPAPAVPLTVLMVSTLVPTTSWEAGMSKVYMRLKPR